MGRIPHRESSQTAIEAPSAQDITPRTPKSRSTLPNAEAIEATLPDRLRRLFSLLSAALLLAFGVWSVLLLVRSHQLRHELGHHLARLDEIRQIRTVLEPWREAPAPPGSGDTADSEATTEPATRPLLDDAIQRLTLGELATQASDDAFVFTVRSLRQALGELAGASDDTERWNASQRALVHLTSLEARLQHRVAAQLRRLDEHWWAFDRQVAGTLVLGILCWILLARGQRRRRELEELRNEAASQALHDGLTGLWNRPAILGHLRDELARSARGSSPLGVILLDIDHFKEINVLLDEDQGDYILEQLAARLSEKVRPYDSLGRLAGDSFLVVLPACDAIATGTVAHRLRESVNEHDVEHGLGRIRITLSMAFTTLHQPTDIDAHLLIHRLEDQLAQPQDGDTGGGLGRIVALDEDPAAA